MIRGRNNPLAIQTTVARMSAVLSSGTGVVTPFGTRNIVAVNTPVYQPASSNTRNPSACPGWRSMLRRWTAPATCAAVAVGGAITTWLLGADTITAGLATLPLFAAAVKTSGPASSEQQTSLSTPVTRDVSFCAVDWVAFFKGIRHSHIAPYSIAPYLRPDGSVDYDMIQADHGYNDLRKILLVDENGKPDVDRIVETIGAFGSDPRLIVFSVPDPQAIPPESQKRIQQTLMNEMNALFERGDILRLFEFLENIFPLFFEAFELRQEDLPEFLQSGIIEHVLPAFADKPDEMAAILITKGFPPERAQSLAEQIQKKKQLIFLWKEIAMARDYPLKQGELESTEASDQEIPREQLSLSRRTSR